MRFHLGAVTDHHDLVHELRLGLHDDRDFGTGSDWYFDLLVTEERKDQYGIIIGHGKLESAVKGC